jgi:hypothetical protein
MKDIARDFTTLFNATYTLASIFSGEDMGSCILILLKNPRNASTGLSMNGKTPMISTTPPFVLRLSKDERRVFQQNRIL